MAKTLTKALMSRMLIAAAEELQLNVSYLNELDAATGDGDHGTSILKAMKAAAEESEKDASFKDMLYNVGFAAESQDCGSTSTLTGSLYQGMSEGVDAEELDADGVIRMFTKGLECVEKSTKAKVGDKTLMDALIPAVDRMKSLIETGASVEDTFHIAAEFARFGAEATKDYVAKFGRAKNLQERSKGHLDAGAVSLSMIFTVFAKTVAEA